MKNLAVIFDMDGVLIDSAALNWKANNEVLAKSGIHVDDEELPQFIGRTLRDQVRMINEKYSASIEYDSFAVETLAIKQKLFEGVEPKSGVMSILTSLQKESIPMAVATSMPIELTKSRLTTAGIIKFFPILVTEEDVSAHKPAPDTFLVAAKRLGAVPSSCVVIEDALVGIQAAHNGGMKCCAVRTPYCREEDLLAADLVVDSLEDVPPDILCRLL